MITFARRISNLKRMNVEWNSRVPAIRLDDLRTPVDKAGATESVAIVAIIWGIAIIIAATNAP